MHAWLFLEQRHHGFHEHFFDIEAAGDRLLRVEAGAAAGLLRHARHVVRTVPSILGAHRETPRARGQLRETSVDGATHRVALEHRGVGEVEADEVRHLRRYGAETEAIHRNAARHELLVRGWTVG